MVKNFPKYFKNILDFNNFEIYCFIIIKHRASVYV